MNGRLKKYKFVLGFKKMAHFFDSISCQLIEKKLRKGISCFRENKEINVVAIEKLIMGKKNKKKN